MFFGFPRQHCWRELQRVANYDDLAHVKFDDGIEKVGFGALAGLVDDEALGMHLPKQRGSNAVERCENDDSVANFGFFLFIRSFRQIAPGTSLEKKRG